MRVLHIGARDLSGGAGRAMYRIHTGLRDIGVDSQILVNQKSRGDETVHGPTGIIGRAYNVLRREIDGLPVRRYRNRKSGMFSPAWLPDRLDTRINRFDPDVVNLHWVGGGVLHPESLMELDYPLVWTMHDMWPFTGGCHYSAGCKKYRDSCGACPKLGSDTTNDLSRRVWKRKKSAWDERSIDLVSPSSWLAGCARRSSLFESASVHIIPNGIDLQTYSPRPKSSARGRFSLPEKSIVLLFGAVAATADPRKGFDLLSAALEKLDSTIGDREVRLAIFGTEDERVIRRRGLTTHELGYVPDDELADLYATADAMLVPSREDNLPNTVMEALACGTPCVAFDVGGIPDLIQDRVNGYLVRPYDIDDFADGIRWVTENERRNRKLSEAARRHANQRYNMTEIAAKYLKLYRATGTESACSDESNLSGAG